MNKNQDKGFTLVELLIVIVILGILATVTVFAVRGITDRGQENACSVDERTLSTAIESYYASYQEDPALIADLTEGRVTSAPGDPVVRDQPLLKDAPSNFTFVDSGIVAADWVDSTGTATAVPANAINNGNAAFFATSDANGGACAA